MNLKFPDDYKTNPDLAGKAVVFDVTVNYIEGDDIVPELTDDFVKGLSITDVSTVDEYRAYVKSQLQTNKESEAESSKQKELLQQAVDNAEIKEIPEELVTEYSAQYTSYYQQYASYFGMEFSDFLTQYMNQTEDDFNKDAAITASRLQAICWLYVPLPRLRRSIRMPFMMRRWLSMQSRAVIQMLQLWRRITARSICVR